MMRPVEWVGDGPHDGSGARAITERARQTAALERALGCEVCTPDGGVVGHLAWLAYGEPHGFTEALMVRPPGWRGLLIGREHQVPIALVERVVGDPPRVMVSERAATARRTPGRASPSRAPGGEDR